MNESETNYNAVPDGFHDCKVVFSRRADKHYGKDINGHIVIEMKLVATDCPEIDNPAAYKAELPVLLIPGFDWDYFNEKTNKGEWRKTTSADTKAQMEFVARCIPEWKAYCDEIANSADAERLAFDWFTDRDYISQISVRAKLTVGTPYTGTDGLEHQRYNAKIYPRYESQTVVADDERKQIANAIKASGVQLFGKKKSPSASPTAPAKPSTPASPSAPKPPPKPSVKPQTKSVDELREEAWANYQRTVTDDPSGAMYYTRAAEIVGKDVNTWESWTVGDWQKIASTFDMPF